MQLLQREQDCSRLEGKTKRFWLLPFWKHKAFVFSLTTSLGAGQSEGVQALPPAICSGQQTQLRPEQPSHGTLVGAEQKWVVRSGKHLTGLCLGSALFPCQGYREERAEQAASSHYQRIVQHEEGCPTSSSSLLELANPT